AARVRRRGASAGQPDRSAGGGRRRQGAETTLCASHAAVRAVDGLSAVEHGVPNPGLSSRGDGRDLALVHYALGVVGTRRHLARAEKYVKNVSIATECGFEPRPADTIPQLLWISAAAAQERCKPVGVAAWPPPISWSGPSARTSAPTGNRCGRVTRPSTRWSSPTRPRP